MCIFSLLILLTINVLFYIIISLAVPIWYAIKCFLFGLFVRVWIYGLVVWLGFWVSNEYKGSVFHVNYLILFSFRQKKLCGRAVVSFPFSCLEWRVVIYFGHICLGLRTYVPVANGTVESGLWSSYDCEKKAVVKLIGSFFCSSLSLYYKGLASAYMVYCTNLFVLL